MEQAQYEQTLPSFDELVKLAENNPDAFERFKRKACEKAITYASAEMQPRLRAQQSHIDRVIRHCKNPHHINVVLARELSLHVIKIQDALDGQQIEVQSAEIIPFSPRH